MENNYDRANNLQNIDVTNTYDENYIKESLDEYANILYEYLMMKDKNAE